MTEARGGAGGEMTRADAAVQAWPEPARRQRQLALVEWLAATDALGDLNDPEVRAAARR